MLREQIIAVSVLSLCLIWTTDGWAQYGRTANHQRGTSLASRLSGLRNSFQNDESSSEKSQASKKSQATKSRSRKSNASSRTSNSHNTQSKHAKKQATKSFLPKISASDLLPGGLFSNGSRETAQKQHAQQPVARHRASSSSAAASPKTTRKTTPKRRAVATARIARRSPDIGSRRDELESALSELLEPRQETDPTAQAIMPPIASESELLPGFLSDTAESQSVAVPAQVAESDFDDQQQDGSAEDYASRSDTSRMATSATRGDWRSRQPLGAPQQAALDLRRALLGGSAKEQSPALVNDSVDENAVAEHGSRIAVAPEDTAAPETANKAVQSEPALASDDAGDADDLALDALAKGFDAADQYEDQYEDQFKSAGQANNAGPVGRSRRAIVEAAMPLETIGALDQVDAEPAGNDLRSPQEQFSVVGEPTPKRLASPAFAEPSDGMALAEEGQADSSNLLFSYKQPVIVSRVSGPRKILVGREAKYRVTLRNLGDTTAESLDAMIRVPEWADIVDATSSRGIVQPVADGSDKAAGKTLRWHLHQLESRSTQTLDLSLVPRSGRPLHLGVSWSHAPVGTEAVVEVQEPKLQLAIDGPSDVLFEKSQRYRLTLSNPGTGVAEQVVLKLLPPGGSASSMTKHAVGPLQPGENKVIELELTAREAGDLKIRAMAEAAGDLHAEIVKQVFCRKPELEIDWRGPKNKYAGTLSTYYLRVRNPGTATTEPLVCKFQLPAGTKFVDASEGELFDAKQNSVTWQLAGLNPREERFLQVQCRLDRPGANAMSLTVQTTTGELRDEKTIETNVVALADLKLSVSDPQGPIPVGEPAMYEIHVVNRGTSDARGVNIVALFSEGIDPISVEGAQYTARDGRVTFHTIKSLPAGSEIVLRIRAKATQPGTHIFRAEVACEDLEIKLAAEETTRFFKDEFRWTDGETPYTAERKSQETAASK